MLALVVTLLFALYILGPDAFSRFILGFSIPRRSVTLTKSEEVYRAVLWSGAGLFASIVWLWADGNLARMRDSSTSKVFFAGLYSEQYFRENQNPWFHAALSFFWMNIAVLWRLYLVVGILSVILIVLIHYYGSIRYRVRNLSWIREFLAAVIPPRIAHWHLLLSPILLRDRGLQIHLDVLIGTDKLYQGRFVDKMLGPDGSLLSITLAQPKRFRREEYIEAKKLHDTAKADDFWRPVPTNMFLIMASTIQTINIRYLPKDGKALKLTSDEMQALFKQLAEEVKAFKESA
jgi:hypothetical protein